MRRSGIVLSEAQRAELRELKASTDERLRERAEIVLALGDGLKVDEAAKRAGTTKNTVTKWKKRYLEGGIGSLRSLHGGGPAPSDGIEDLQGRIREALATKRSEPWTRETLAEAVGTDTSRLGRELTRMGVTLSRTTRWEFPAPTAASARTSCLAGLFLSASERCVVTCVSDGELDVVGGAVVTRDRLLAEALAPAGDLTLEDALWTAADHVGDPGKRRPTTMAEFLSSVASALPKDAAIRAVALVAEAPRWGGKAPVGLSWCEVADAPSWDAAARSLLGQFGPDAAPVLEGIARLCGALLPTTDPFVWVRGATEACAADARACVDANCGSHADDPAAARFATVEDALAAVVGGGGAGVDVSIIVVANTGDGIEWRHVVPPEPMPGDAPCFDSADSVVASFDAVERPLLLLRDEAGRQAAELWLDASKKKTARAGSTAS